MPTAANGSGSANDAEVISADERLSWAGAPAHGEIPAHDRSREERTAAEQEYLEALADDGERAVKDTRRMIADLEKSLKDREAAAKTARAHAQGKSKE